MSDLEYRRGIIPQIKKACRLLIAFTFSHVGVCVLVIGYIIFGAFLFQYIESDSPEVQQAEEEVVKSRNETAERLLDIMLKLQINKTEYLAETDLAIFNYTAIVVTAVMNGYDIPVTSNTNSTHSKTPNSIQWGFSGAFLYSLTVITTIGYGNVAPKTTPGKVTTIIYGIVGMPLFLLYLSNIGDILARGFKFIYSKFCQCRWNCARNSRESDDEGSNTFEMIPEEEQVTVPISVCLVLMVAYIWGGGIWFATTEGWTVLDASYFCFISLSTIGFGDLVPGTSVDVSNLRDAIQVPFIFCSVYLLLGMALIAMCFNLGQQEVIASVKRIASRIGILKEEGVR